MPRSRQAFGFGRVNLLKKVHVGGEWKFCPAVVEAGRRLNDLVRVNGQIETHYEGTYYLDWREQGKRRRQPVRNRALVFEQARLKALELEAQRNRGETASTQRIFGYQSIVLPRLLLRTLHRPPFRATCFRQRISFGKALRRMCRR